MPRANVLVRRDPFSGGGIRAGTRTPLTPAIDPRLPTTSTTELTATQIQLQAIVDAQSRAAQDLAATAIAQARFDAAQARLRRAGLGTGGFLSRVQRIGHSGTFRDAAATGTDLALAGQGGRLPIDSLGGDMPSFRDRAVDFGLDFVLDQLGGGGGDTLVPGAIPQQDPCPGGFRIPGTNQCLEGPIQPMQPAGPTVSQAQGVAPGAFGVLSTEPQVFSSVRLRCPPGLVLGKDNRCYARGGKAGISNSQRKWPAAPKPALSAFDKRMMKKYGPGGSKQKSIKKIAQDAGFTCSTRGRSRSKKD